MKRQSNKIPKTTAEAERFLWHAIDHLGITNVTELDALEILREHISQYFAPHIYKGLGNTICNQCGHSLNNPIHRGSK